MKKMILSLTAVLLAVMISFTCLADGKSNGSSEKLSFSATTLYGKTISSSSFKDYDLIMMNFWAEWCGPCVNELPALQKIHQKYKNMLLIGVWLGNSLSQAKTTAENAGVTYPLIYMDNSFYQYLDIGSDGSFGIPQTCFFDNSGKQIGDAYVGGMDYDTWDSIVSQLFPEGYQEEPVIPVSSITLNKTKATLTRTAGNPNPTLQLTAAIEPADATDPSVQWTSSNPEIATVDENGLVTALKEGTTQIICTARDSIAEANVPEDRMDSFADESRLIAAPAKGRNDWSATVKNGNEVTAVCEITVKDQLNAPSPTDVEINEENFPDAIFRKYVQQYDTDGDHILSSSELSCGTWFELDNMGIASLSGIMFFSSLQYLSCSGNNLTELDVSYNRKLECLNCSDNQITSLNISGCNDLGFLWCRNNRIAALDVTHAAKLETLECGNNQIKKLDVSNNKLLNYLGCYQNNLTALDVSDCILLDGLDCYQNNLQILDVSCCPSLKHFQCMDDNLTTLNISGCDQLTSLFCRNNHLTELDAAHCKNMIQLDCSGNQLTSLNVSGMKDLQTLWCDGNKLTNLDLSQCSKMTSMNCDSNQLKKLTLKNCISLQSMRCIGNQLPTLDLSDCHSLASLYAHNNNFDTLDVSSTILRDMVQNNTRKESSNTSYWSGDGINYGLDLLVDGYVTVLAGNMISYPGTPDPVLIEGVYSVTIVTDGNGIAYADPCSGASGVEVTLTAMPNEGYVFQEWQVLSGNVTVLENKFTINASNVKIKAVFEATANPIPVSAITLNKTKATLTRTADNPNPTLQLTATVKPEDATDPSVEWTSSDPDVAMVDENGLVTALKEGTATIICTARDSIAEASTLEDAKGEFADDNHLIVPNKGKSKRTDKRKNGSAVTAECEITVENQQVTKIKLNKTKATLTRTSSNKKPTLQLKATVTPKDATDPSVEWKSSDPKIAKVDKTGKVTALKAGKVTITCTAKDGSGKKATCKITVKDQLVTKLTLNKKTLSLKKGKIFKLKVTISPAGALNKKVKWTSSDKKVATVDKNGKVKAVGKGTCVITCAALDSSGKKVTCKITVK